MTFSSSEQAYQYFKALFHSKYYKCTGILKTHNPSRIYAIGHSIVTSKVWEGERVKVMLHILRHKLYQCESFRAELLAAADTAVFTEATRDKFWAIGNGSGLNTLGVLLHIWSMSVMWFARGYQ